MTVWRIEVESVTPDKTRIYFRDDSEDGPCYWEIETLTQPHRIYREIRYNGWHVATCDSREYVDGSETRLRISDKRPQIPDEVLSHLPSDRITT